MGVLLPLLAQFGPLLIQGLAKLFEAKIGPKNGAVKKEAVMSIILPLLDKLLAGTGIPVNQDLVSKLVDDLVAQMNKTGELSPGVVAGSAMTISGTLQVQR